MINLKSLVSIDTETDGLVPDYTKMHVAVARDYATKKDHLFYLHKEADQKAFVELLKGYDHIAAHNAFGFDRPAIRDLLGYEIPREKILDTLVMSRLLNYQIDGGHSIEAIGKRLGIKKKHSGLSEWTQYSSIMMDRCISDVEILDAFVTHISRFLTDPEWKLAIETEHWAAYMAQIMRDNGLPFNKRAAEELYSELLTERNKLDEIIYNDFKPSLVVVKEFTPKLTQKGTFHKKDFLWASTRAYELKGNDVLLGDYIDTRVPDLSEFKVGETYRVLEEVPFNPASPKQMVERLNEAGWKPIEKTDGHKNAEKNPKVWREKKDHYEKYGWKVSETNLATLPESAPPAAKALAKRIVIASRCSDLEEWLGLVTDEHKIHPTFNSIGAWTHRMSHSKPNSANIPVAKRSPKDTEFQKYINDVNDRMRALFTAPPGYRQVGTDADGIQMRIFAHLVGDEKLIKALVEGKKEDESDIHSLHRSFLGEVCKSRDTAKTFIYAWLLGAGNGQVSSVLECSLKQAKEAVQRFIESYPGLKKLKKERIPSEAKKGFFIGLDGRKVVCNSEHLMLAGHLQNGEKVIMTLAAKKWMEDADREGIPYILANWVHDEWQVFVPDDDELCKRFQQIQLDAFEYVGRQLNLKCPLAGSSDWGYTWKDTH